MLMKAGVYELLGIDQADILVMVECHHSKLLWFKFGLPLGTQNRSEAMEEALEVSRAQLQAIVHQVLEILIEQGDHPMLTPEVCRGLLQGPPLDGVGVDIPPVEPQEQPPHGAAASSDGLALLAGYPSYPLYHRLSDSLAYWMVSGKCPAFDLPEMFMLNEQDTLDERHERLELAGSKMGGAYSLWEHWSEDEKKFHFMDLLKLLGLRGVLDLLGVRKTAGSSELLPPPKEVLLKTFNTQHSPAAKLTVGARALSKHHHRDDSLQWWGKCTGSDAAKNENATRVVTKIMREATWINIHALPQEVKVIEMRTVEGYGARWLHDGSEFRGFLEPQMEDGHQVGWKH